MTNMEKKKQEALNAVAFAHSELQSFMRLNVVESNARLHRFATVISAMLEKCLTKQSDIEHTLCVCTELTEFFTSNSDYNLYNEVANFLSMAKATVEHEIMYSDEPDEEDI